MIEQEKREGMIYGAFIGDALSLSAHWIYNIKTIEKKAGRIINYTDPLVNTFHPTKKAGQLTHYGEQMLFFLRYMAETGELNKTDYITRYRKFFSNYSGYIDQATKDTLINMEKGVSPPGSKSNDLASILYLPVLAYLLPEDEETLLDKSSNTAAMTHNSPKSLSAARFLAKILSAVLSGAPPHRAIEDFMEDESLPEHLLDLAMKGERSIGRQTDKAIGKMGQDGSVDHAFPCVIHLIGAYENNLETALIQNVMSGGDSAVRGIITGAVLGAHLGIGEIPLRWMEGLVARDEIAQLIGKLQDRLMP